MPIIYFATTSVHSDVNWNAKRSFSLSIITFLGNSSENSFSNCLFTAFEISVLENQKRTAFVLQNCPMVGNDADTFLGIAAVIDKDADKHATGLPLSNADGQVLVELGKAAGLEDVGEHIGGDFGIPLLQAPHAVGGEIGGDKGNHDRHHDGGIDEWTEQPQRREAGRIHHNDL